ncbi:MAG: transcriptional regulator [Nitrosopumilaceae archaeon]
MEGGIHSKKANCQLLVSLTFYSILYTPILVIMFEKFRKKKEEYGESGGSEMVEERPVEEYHPEEIISEPESRIPPPSENRPQTQTSSQSEGQIGIRALKDKRVKLEEAIDFVGLMIKNLKDKRTNLEKEIEDESVDIKNLKEKLMKVSEYIEEENQGIQNLTRKRSSVENEADNVGSMINNLRGKLSGIDSIINIEGEKIKNFKESRKES